MTLDQNVAQCITASTSIGHWTYFNVCTGTSVTVPWGSVDWTCAGIFAVVGLFGVFVITNILVSAFKG